MRPCTIATLYNSLYNTYTIKTGARHQNGGHVTIQASQKLADNFIPPTQVGFFDAQYIKGRPR